MPQVGLRNVVERLRRGLADRDTDGDLLERYVADGNGAAFAELVRRHGPKVYAVCRRVLGQHQLAEDAYQATFVVLTKKARAIQPRSAVGGFLYGVARRAALEAYAVSRRRKETLVGRVPDRPAPFAAADPDVLAMLDEEIANLSEALRAAVVLCELDGVGRADAARQLGIAEGTLSSRLAAARKQLASKLKSRGVLFSAGLFAALSSSANAVGPPALKGTSATVTAIAGGVMRTMMLAKLKAASTLGILVVAFATWSLLPTAMPEAVAKPDINSASRLSSPKADRPLHPIAAPPEKAQMDGGNIILSSFAADLPKFKILKPDSKGEHRFSPGDQAPWNIRISPSGRLLAFSVMEPNHGSGVLWNWTRHSVRVMRLDGFAVKTLVENVYCPSLAWTADEKLAVSQIDPDKYADADEVGKEVAFKTFIYDPTTRAKTQLSLPGNQMVLALSPDGNGVISSTAVVGKHTKSIYRSTLKEPKPELLSGPDEWYQFQPRFSPDGKSVVALGSFANSKDEKSKSMIHVYDWAKKTERRIELAKEFAGGRIAAHLIAWSPDGTRLAFVWTEEIPMPLKPRRFQVPTGDGSKPKWFATRVTICDVDGANPKTILRSNDDDEICGLEWGQMPEPKVEKPMNVKPQ